MLAPELRSRRAAGRSQRRRCAIRRSARVRLWIALFLHLGAAASLLRRAYGARRTPQCICAQLVVGRCAPEPPHARDTLSLVNLVSSVSCRRPTNKDDARMLVGSIDVNSLSASQHSAPDTARPASAAAVTCTWCTGHLARTTARLCTPTSTALLHTHQQCICAGPCCICPLAPLDSGKHCSTAARPRAAHPRWGSRRAGPGGGAPRRGCT